MERARKISVLFHSVGEVPDGCEGSLIELCFSNGRLVEQHDLDDESGLLFGSATLATYGKNEACLLHIADRIALANTRAGLEPPEIFMRFIMKDGKVLQVQLERHFRHVFEIAELKRGF